MRQDGRPALNSTEWCLLALLGTQCIKSAWLVATHDPAHPLTVTKSYEATFITFAATLALLAMTFGVRRKFAGLKDAARLLWPLAAATVVGAVIGLSRGNLRSYFIADLGKFCVLILCIAVFSGCRGQVRWPIYAVFFASLMLPGNLLGPHGSLFMLPFLVPLILCPFDRLQSGWRWLTLCLCLVVAFPLLARFCVFDKASLAATLLFLIVAASLHRRRAYVLVSLLLCGFAVTSALLLDPDSYLAQRLGILRGAVTMAMRHPGQSIHGVLITEEEWLRRHGLDRDSFRADPLVEAVTERSWFLRQLERAENALDESTGQRMFELRMTLAHTIYSGDLMKVLFGRGFGATFRLPGKFSFAWEQWPDPGHAHTIHSTPFFVLHLLGLVGAGTIGVFVLSHLRRSLVAREGDRPAMMIALVFLILSCFSPNFLISWMALSFFACGLPRPAAAQSVRAAWRPPTVAITGESKASALE